MPFETFWRYQVIPGFLLGIHRALEECGAAVRDRIREKIGYYQPDSHGYNAWAPLAYTTLYGWGPNPGKIARGQTGRRSQDDPGLATGDSLNSIRYVTHGRDLAVTIGSDQEQMFFFEFGTVNQPPRPLFRPAAEEVVEKFQARFGEFAVAGIMGAATRTLFTSARLAQSGPRPGYADAARPIFRGFTRGFGMWRSRF